MIFWHQFFLFNPGFLHLSCLGCKVASSDGKQGAVGRHVKQQKNRQQRRRFFSWICTL